MKDVFGRALLGYWKGDHKSKHLIRRDDGWQDTSSLGKYFSKKLYPTERAVVQYMKGNILDVGCGAGRHVLHFQKKGFDITGIDSSPCAIEVCKMRGCKKVQNKNIFKNNFKKNSFDTILLFGHNIGIAGTMKKAQELLQILRELAAPDGILLLTSINVIRTKREIHKKYQQKNLAMGRYVGELKIRIEYKGFIGNWFPWLHIKPNDLKRLGSKTSWKQEYILEEESGEYAAILRAI